MDLISVAVRPDSATAAAPVVLCPDNTRDDYFALKFNSQPLGNK